MRDALRDYVSVLESNVSILKSAADQCSSTMGDGEISGQYIGNLNEGIRELFSVSEKAEEVRQQLDEKIKIIIEIKNSAR